MVYLHRCLKFQICVIPLFIYFLLNSSTNEQQLITLNDSNWRLMLQKEWMVAFYAPWCPSCNSSESVWKKFSLWGVKNFVNVAQIDIVHSPGLRGRFMVTALPAIYHVIDSEFRQYEGAINLDELIQFITEDKWKKVKQISNWKSPNSFQMSVVAWFFKGFHILWQYIHTKIIEDFGLPRWVLSGIFGIAAIVICRKILLLILGFILISICSPEDFFLNHDESPEEHIRSDQLHKSNSTLNDCDTTCWRKRKRRPRKPNRGTELLSVASSSNVKHYTLRVFCK